MKMLNSQNIIWQKKISGKGAECDFIIIASICFLLTYFVLEVNTSHVFNEPNNMCAWRSGDLEFESFLHCKIRTLDNLEELIQNISSKREDIPSSIQIECSDILFFESNLGPEEKNTNNFKPNFLRELDLKNCKIRRVFDNAFSKFKNLIRLKLTTYNNDWPAMTMDLKSNSFFGLDDLQILHLGHNNIWELPANVFCSNQNLHVLNLTDNHLQNLNSLGFSSMDFELKVPQRTCDLMLEVLDLSKNDIIALPDYGLATLRSLRQLYLQNNIISSIGEYTFSGLNRLQILNMSSNFLSMLPSGTFNDCRKIIKHIILSNNSINMLPAGLFEGLEQLQILDLSRNYISSNWINRDTFSGLIRIVIINLSFNNLLRIEKMTFKKLFSLQSLNLEHNKIEFIDDGSFGEMKNLHSLYLSNNRIKQIDESLFSKLTVLNQLYLDNNTISIIDKKAFQNLTSLEDLVLSSNKLEEIPEAIKNIRTLKSLDLGNNFVTYAEKQHFTGLNQLFGLRLVDNKISYLLQDTFEYLTQLQVLNLASNIIKTIEPGCFRKNNNLKMIRLDCNELSTLFGIFNGLNSLVWLNISQNNIFLLDFKSLPPSVEWLDAHKNIIGSLIYDNIPFQHNIKTLDLSNNKLQQLSRHNIPKSVENLYMHQNKLTSIQSGTFSQLPNLLKVTLNGNDIERLELNAFQLDVIAEEFELPEFFISNNPFICDCSTEWLQRINHLSHSRLYPRVMDLDKTVCTVKYSRLKSKKAITDMKSSDFLCPYTSHCFALCHCCDFDACDCEMICPERCSCYHDITWSSNVVDCSMANYSKVPEKIPMDATEIYLDGNYINKLNNHIFIGKKKLQVLYLNNTELQEVNNETFKGIDSLRILHLENNRLAELKGDEFNQLNNLSELYLDHNTISKIGNNTFSSMHSLKILRIDENKLTNFLPWQLLAFSIQSSSHVSFEGNKWSCDCHSLSKLEFWLRNKSGDPEKMFCSDESGKKEVTIASVLSRCKYFNEENNELIFQSSKNFNVLFFDQSYFTIFASIIIIIIVICFIGAVIYAFRYDLKQWIFDKYGFPSFKSRIVRTNDFPGSFNIIYECHFLYNTKDFNFLSTEFLPELERRGILANKNCLKNNSNNISILENYAKSEKIYKRLLIILTENFVTNELDSSEFRIIFLHFMNNLNHLDRKKIVFVFLYDNLESDNSIHNLTCSFKCVLWSDVKFWDSLKFLLATNDTYFKIKTNKNCKSPEKKSTLKYTAVPMMNCDTLKTKTFSNKQSTEYSQSVYEEYLTPSYCANIEPIYYDIENRHNFISINNRNGIKNEPNSTITPQNKIIKVNESSSSSQVKLNTMRNNNLSSSNSGKMYFV